MLNYQRVYWIVQPLIIPHQLSPGLSYPYRLMLKDPINGDEITNQYTRATSSLCAVRMPALEFSDSQILPKHQGLFNEDRSKFVNRRISIKHLKARLTALGRTDIIYIYLYIIIHIIIHMLSANTWTYLFPLLPLSQNICIYMYIYMYIYICIYMYIYIYMYMYIYIYVYICICIYICISGNASPLIPNVDGFGNTKSNMAKSDIPHNHIKNRYRSTNRLCILYNIYIINYVDTIQIKEQKRVFSRNLPLFSESGMAHKMLQWTQRIEFFATAPLVALCWVYDI